MKTTKIAIASRDGKTKGHAGTTRHFTVYEVEDKRIVSKEELTLQSGETLRKIFHDPEMKDVHSPLFDMDYLFVTSIGRGAVHRLMHKGVRAYVVAENESTDKIIDELLNGTLTVYEPHDHHHDHHHGHDGHHHHH